MTNATNQRHNCETIHQGQRLGTPAVNDLTQVPSLIREKSAITIFFLNNIHLIRHEPLTALRANTFEQCEG